MKEPLRILFVGITAPDKSMRDIPYIKALEKKGVVFLTCFDTTPGLKKYPALVRKFRSLRVPFDIVWVGHTSALTVPLLALLTRKPVLFNALCPQYEGEVVDRNDTSPYSLRAILIWCVDVLSFWFATAVLLETNAQIENVHSTFFTPKRKLFRIFTTVDPELYHPDASVEKPNAFTCVFRGWITPSTGVEYILDAARILKHDNVSFRFLGRGPLAEKFARRAREQELTNVTFDTAFHDFGALLKGMLASHVFLGQFSDHPRMKRTIQFKTVEAAACGLPYITADLPSNRELLTDGQNCLFVAPRDANALASNIRRLKSDPVLREKLGEAAYELYRRELAPEVLASQILGIIERLLAR